MKTRRAERAFTIIELIVAIAVAGVLLAIAGPSFRDFILLQRLKGINAQIVTDLQFARAEATARGMMVTFRLGTPSADSAQSCYVIFADPTAPPSQNCDCHRAPALRCQGNAVEIRTVTVPVGDGVTLSRPAAQADRFSFDPIAGGILLPIVEVGAGDGTAFAVGAAVNTERSLRTVVGLSGRPTVCSPSGSIMSEPACADD